MKHAALSLCLLGSLALSSAAYCAAPVFKVGEGKFLLDGKPFVVRSGEIHYTRIPRGEWKDRLLKIKAMGLNTVTTLAFWNASEVAPGKFDFSGNSDIAAFIRTARDVGLYVIVRPGPFICGEWEFGGFPAWLQATPGLRVRTVDPRFLAASAAWFKRLGQEISPLQATHGGPIIMMQVENEYGYVGNDQDYMRAIDQQMLDAGFDVPFFMSNGPGPTWISRGTLPGTTPVINSSGNAGEVEKAFTLSAPVTQGAPKMFGEYWTGWPNNWGKPHQLRDASIVDSGVGYFLDHDISFNLYMVDGGTNFGWMAGANDDDNKYTPLATSYDYDAPISEGGRLTPKYWSLRKLIQAHLPKGETLPTPPLDSPMVAVPRFTLGESISLLDALPALSTPRDSLTPRSMEHFGQSYGLVLYRTKVDKGGKGSLDISDVHDFADVLVDGKPLGTLDRRLDQHTMDVDLAPGSTLDLVVEGMGRTNIGDWAAFDVKGIDFYVKLAGWDLTGWQVYPLPLGDLSGLAFHKGAKASGPTFWHGRGSRPPAKAAPSWTCADGARAMPGSMAITWAVTGTSARSGPSTYPGNG